MTPEKLDMYKRLQPVFPKDWKFGDRFTTVYRGKRIIGIVYLIDDDTICTVTDKFGKVNFQSDDEALIRIPFPIDRDNPERGLWGMVGWSKYECWLYDGKMSIHSKDREEIGPRYSDPETALLKALAE
jgi:hypothetical protein